ncbi:MAG: class I SAM-dependent rRNA methyltransferase [Desulfuromonadales bacterium]|nr:class I SAM-dependent rRNA methyltransferase [Desulfuromonadales bacterium]
MKKCLVGPETKRILLQGHPWVIADRYTRQWPKVANGELVMLVDEQRQPLAVAICDPQNRIVARRLSGDPESISSRWLEEQFQDCLTLRHHALLGDSDCYRLVNGEGDALPGVTVDRYGDYLMLQLYTTAWEAYRSELVAALANVFRPKGIYLKYRPQQTRKLEAQNKSRQINELLAGAAAPDVYQVKEDGLYYQVNLQRGLHTGLFPDQRRNRRELTQRVAGMQVLNLFAFTGAFSVAAAAAGASRVTSVDVSEKYLAIARENFKANRIDPQQHEFIVGDVFAELAKFQTQGRRFDCVLFDPPSFSTTKKSRFATHGGTSSLVSELLPLLSSGGLLVGSSNHQKVSLDDYMKELRRGVADGSRLKTVYVGGQSEDFPCDLGFPEGRYLKFVICVRQ